MADEIVGPMDAKALPVMVGRKRGCLLAGMPIGATAAMLEGAPVALPRIKADLPCPVKAAPEPPSALLTVKLATRGRRRHLVLVLHGTRIIKQYGPFRSRDGKDGADAAYSAVMKSLADSPEFLGVTGTNVRDESEMVTLAELEAGE